MGGLSRKGVTLAAAAYLAGCVSAANYGGYRSGSRAVLAGDTIRLNSFMDLNDDCTSKRLPTIKVLREPVHGRVSTAISTGFPGYPPHDIRSACNGRRVPAIAVLYRAGKSSGLNDEVVFETVWISTSLWHSSYTISIR
jgi:hypothetical protein